jgi:hypothetical protein
MALALVNANLVRQKAYNAVYGTGTGTTTNTVSPYHFYAIKSFFLFLAANKNNPDLQFLPYTAEQAVTNLGTSLVGGACTLYLWYGKARRTSGTTASFQAIHDAADNSATTTTVDTALVKLTGNQFIFVHPNGVAIATDVVISAATAVGGATESSAADATDGFIIVGA